MIPNKPTLAILAFHEPPGDALRGAEAAGSEGVESRRNVIIGFHFVLMPGSHHNRQKPESPVGVASREPGAGLRGTRASLAHRVVWGSAGLQGAVASGRRVSVGPSAGLRGSAMPGVEHGSGVNDTNPESGRRRERASGAKNPPVRSCPELREWTNEPTAHQVARNA